MGIHSKPVLAGDVGGSKVRLGTLHPREKEASSAKRGDLFQQGGTSSGGRCRAVSRNGPPPVRRGRVLRYCRTGHQWAMQGHQPSLGCFRIPVKTALPMAPGSPDQRPHGHGHCRPPPCRKRSPSPQSGEAHPKPESRPPGTGGQVLAPPCSFFTGAAIFLFLPRADMWISLRSGRKKRPC